MTDNKRKRGKQDQANVSSREVYEVAYIAKKFGVTQALVREVIRLVGTSRRNVYAAIRALLDHVQPF